MNKEVSIKCIYSKLIFWSTISRNHLQVKTIYLDYSKMRSLATVKKNYGVAR